MDEQVREFRRMVFTDPAIAEIVERMAHLWLPDCRLTAGAVGQTVWNVLTDRDPQAGIVDDDINYFDASDLSREAEDRAIAAASSALAGIAGEIQVRNEARVHLWDEDKFGVPCPPYRSTPHAISTFPSCSSRLAIRASKDGVDVFAPFGLTDLFRMTTRPNPVLAPREVYEAKTRRWAREWPELTVLPWLCG